MAKIKNRNPDIHRHKPSSVHRRAYEKVYWPYIPIVLIIGMLLTFGMQSGNLVSYMKHPGGRVLAYADSMTIGDLLSDTNAQRVANGLAPLKLNDKLDAAAQASADDMAARNYWSHYTPDGNPPWVWVTNQGYSYQKLGQNLAAGFSDEQATIDGWMASPPHRENLLDPDFDQVGFGYANIADYTSAGGGPMTVVVAFYGEPRVLAASTAAPAASAPQKPAAPAKTASATATPAPAAASKPKTDTKRPATTTTPLASLTPAVKSSRLQLAIGNTFFTRLLTMASVVASGAIIILWSHRHLRAIHRFLLKGESYALSHPLTDIGMVIIACLLFILSQTAGIIQ
ncbi:MAG TPA: CAP domain-containing protein [Candidatus Saccharimonadales bacterium]|nr:CAP domain-containing protein [Candidatus Saccharimonadales bacterium]